MINHYITWWNVENLFDIDDAPADRRPADIARKLHVNLTGWNQQLLDRKIRNLAHVIHQINDGLGPDILGICEVENAHVLNLLAKAMHTTSRKYKLIHHDTRDNRGIDVAFIYDGNKYQFNKKEFFHHEVIKRYATREIIQATLITENKNELILLGNHWPSRSGSQYASEPYRIIAGETLSYFIERIQHIKGENAAILVMGDFNDEPFNRSLTDYALSVSEKERVIKGKNPYLLNMMWPILGSRRGSYVYDGKPMVLDQFLAAKGIVAPWGRFSIKETARLEIFPGMIKGSYHKPVRFGIARPNKNGYSDHLPVSVVVEEKDG